MNIQEALTKKAEEVFDLYSRGLLTVFYNAAWEDVVKIVKSYPTVKPIHILANNNKLVVRFSADSRPVWLGTIRPTIKGQNAVEITANSYEECEFKVRQYIMKLSGEIY